MKIPRDLSGRDLVKALGNLDYAITRQSGSHIRVTTERRGEHHITIPDHDSLRIGTVSSILRAVAEHCELSRDQLLNYLFG